MTKVGKTGVILNCVCFCLLFQGILGAGPPFSAAQIPVESLDVAAINSEGTVVATVSRFLDHVLLKVSSYRGQTKLNETETVISITPYIFWLMKISKTGNRIMLLPYHNDSMILLDRNSSGQYDFAARKTVLFSSKVEMIDMSADGKLILVSDYYNFTQLYEEDSTGNFAIKRDFDPKSNLIGPTISRVQSRGIELSNNGNNVIVNVEYRDSAVNHRQTSLLIYSKNSQGDYGLEQIFFDPETTNGIYSTMLSADGNTLLMRGMFGPRVYKRNAIGQPFIYLQSLTGCWDGGVNSAILTDDAGTAYVLCRKYKIILVYARNQLGFYVLSNNITDVVMDKLYSSGDGSRLLYANYRNNSVTLLSFSCAEDEYYSRGVCQTCTETEYQSGVCGRAGPNLTLILCLSIIPMILLIILVVVVIFVRKNILDKEVVRVKAANESTVQNVVFQPRTYIMEIEEPVHEDRRMKRRRKTICPLCEKSEVGHQINCRHVFHEDCIRAWIYRGNDYCPVCKAPAELIDINVMKGGKENLTNGENNNISSKKKSSPSDSNSN